MNTILTVAVSMIGLAMGGTSSQRLRRDLPVLGTQFYQLRAAEEADRQFVLHGRNQPSELLYMEDVVQPGSSGVLEKELAEWGVCILDNNILGVRDGTALTNRSFVTVHPETVDSKYEVASDDGECRPSHGVNRVNVGF